MVMSPVKLGTKNHCAGENQQQFGSQSSSVAIGQTVQGWRADETAGLIPQSRKSKTAGQKPAPGALHQLQSAYELSSDRNVDYAL
jgi:hypothetical protein